jgi:hypothetical protein
VFDCGGAYTEEVSFSLQNFEDEFIVGDIPANVFGLDIRLTTTDADFDLLWYACEETDTIVCTNEVQCIAGFGASCVSFKASTHVVYSGMNYTYSGDDQQDRHPVTHVSFGGIEEYVEVKQTTRVTRIKVKLNTSTAGNGKVVYSWDRIEPCTPQLGTCQECGNFECKDSNEYEAVCLGGTPTCELKTESARLESRCDSYTQADRDAGSVQCGTWDFNIDGCCVGVTDGWNVGGSTQSSILKSHVPH